MSSKIDTAIANVKAKIKAVEKYKPKTGISYKVRTIDQFMNVLHPLMSEEKLFIVPVDEEIISKETKELRNSVATNIIIKVTYEFRCGGEKVQTKSSGEGQDSGDKALSKAQTMSYKRLLDRTFMIPTEDLEDPDLSAPEPQTKPKSSMKEFKQLVQYFDNTFLNERKDEAREELAKVRGIKDPGTTGGLIKAFLEPLGATFTENDVFNISSEAIEDVKQHIKAVIK